MLLNIERQDLRRLKPTLQKNPELLSGGTSLSISTLLPLYLLKLLLCLR